MILEETTVEAVRTHHTTKIERAVEVVFEIDRRSFGMNSLRITHGGIVDYPLYIPIDENFEITRRRQLTSKGWTACTGMEGQWDQLWISPQGMKRVFHELGI